MGPTGVRAPTPAGAHQRRLLIAGRGAWVQALQNLRSLDEARSAWDLGTQGWAGLVVVSERCAPLLAGGEERIAVVAHAEAEAQRCVGADAAEVAAQFFAMVDPTP